ncbi:unnamed protein product [Darwinula stevensoni]|uniref:Uncharacterized protein n=1 Tax=Darwinula stevensoni TaxID=69355 RepID=A0A7R9AFE0_9CRUS|nr:unnamed protein product [Darwinula stevensoni]CAG0903197.1 unnamed protein product [Darwinula stevensoni]
MRNINGTMDPIVIICGPRSFDPLRPDSVVSLVAAGVQLITFLLLLFLTQERKSFPGKIRLLYVGITCRPRTYLRILLAERDELRSMVDPQVMSDGLGLYIKLFFLMGLTWLVVLFGYIFMKTKVFLLIATILESVQGVFIFFIVCKKDTMQYMRRTSQEWFSRFRQRAESSSSTGGTVESQSTQPFGLYIKLFVLMGLTWLVGLCSYFMEEEVFSYVEVILQSSQGAFIFLIFMCKDTMPLVKKTSQN